MEKRKYALLDTDFISKMHFVQKDSENHLIDRILELPGYTFFCHQQIVRELARHNQNAPVWLEKRIEEQKIVCYTDEQILEELKTFRGNFAYMEYTTMLKSGCEAFSSGYFNKYYHDLEEIDYGKLNQEQYLDLLRKLDDKVGEHNSLGEIKSYVLLQLLSLLLGEHVYIFCSDDKNARNGVLSFGEVRCISVLTSFSRLKSDMKWSLKDAQPYMDSLVGFYNRHGQENVKVVEASKIYRMCRIPCEQALKEIFEDKFIELQNGLLKYKE